MVDKDTCKYMCSRMNWTPNDWEVWFQHNKIPSNIIVEDVPNLSERLDKLTPLSKKVHIMLNTSNEEYTNTISLVSDLSITVNKTVKQVKIL